MMNPKTDVAKPQRSLPDISRPDSPFSALQRSIIEEFERFARGFGLELAWSPMAGAIPAVNVAEQDGVLLVEADLPGIDCRDIEVTLQDDLLTLKGERRTGQDDRRRNTFRRESKFGVFQRSVRLPAPVQAEGATASFANGVLKIALPVQAASPNGAHKIAITGA